MDTFDLSDIWDKDNEKIINPEDILLEIGETAFREMFDNADKYYQSLPYDGNDAQVNVEYILECWLDEADDIMEDFYQDE